MDAAVDGDAGRGSGAQVGATESMRVLDVQAEVRRHAETLEDLRRQAVAVTLLSWESPAGRHFRTYLLDRCAELARIVELLGSAADALAGYGRLVEDAELLQGRAAGP